MNEVEHVALDAAAGAEAVEDLLLEVDRAGGLRVVMEGAADLALHSPARREAVVGEDGAEVRACLDLIEVDATITVISTYQKVYLYEDFVLLIEERQNSLMRRKELTKKWWYRLLQVTYGLICFCH